MRTSRGRQRDHAVARIGLEKIWFHVVVLSSLLVVGACNDTTRPEQNPPVVVAGQPVGTLGTRTAVPDRPFGIAISTTDQVYVTRLDGAVSRGTLPSFSVEGEISVGSVPRFVAFSPDGAKAFVANEFSGTVSRIDVATHLEDGLLTLPGDLFRLAVSADGSILYAAGNADHVFVIDAATGLLITFIPVDLDPNGMVFSPDGSSLYVSHISGASVVEIETGTNTVSRTFNLGQSASQDMAVSTDGKTLYVAMEGGQRIQKINLSTGQLAGSIGLPSGAAPFGMAMTPSGMQLYVSGGSTTGAIYIVDLATETIVNTLMVGGNPRRIAFSADGLTALFTNESGWVDTIN